MKFEMTRCATTVGALSAGTRCRLPLLLLCILIAVSSHAESLRVVEEYKLDKYYGVSYALRAGGDTVMFIATGGLYVQGSSEQEWHKLIERVPPDEHVPFSFCDTDRLDRLIEPGGLWQHQTQHGSEILIFDGFCNRLQRLSQDGDGTSFLNRCDKRRGYDLFGNANVQGDFMLAALFGNDTEKRIVIQKVGRSDYRRLFRCSEELVRWRDSVSLDHSYVGYPAIDPHDSTLWLAVDGYPYVYLIDMAGKLRDSVPITNADYRRPPQTKSRIESSAVSNEWFVRWTPIMSFAYVDPGYFILQYRVGKDNCVREELGRRTTIVWDTNRQIVPMTIDPLWHLAGVQDDGRILFVAPTPDSSGCTETILVTRIEP